MNSKSHPRFDPHALRDLAGDAVFAPGEAYFPRRDGGHSRHRANPDPLRVAGTEYHRTVITGQHTAIDGECSCPAFEREGFCNHMVAVALAANAAVASGEADSGDTLARVRGYLRTRSADALVGMITDMAERDPALLRKLKIATATAGADDKALESQLRGAIR
jgi:uncharacterized Zn finger protein